MRLVDRSAARLRWGLPVLLAVVVAVAVSVGEGGWNADIIWQLRLPRVLAGMGVGALLAQAGLSMQILLRNPLADPYVLGASGGAGLGAIAALLFGAALWLGSVIGAGLVLLLLLLMGSRFMASRDDEASAQLILIGAMLAAIAGALSTLLLSLVPDQQLRGAMFWLVGNLSGAEHGLALCVLAVLAAGWLAWRQRAYDRLLLGSEAAWLLGEPVARIRLELVLLAAVATGASVAVAGAVGFVGLVVPQALRLLGLHRMRDLAWAVPLAGAALVVAADTLARGIIMPYELPVGAVTALVGAPIFILMLRRS
ncbi:ABC-type Fe3+-siderophore transport system, permease component [Thiomonas bhubaneswarensis]|uniref:ABC-type Fe3+-siderophore transport system, permease component n=2 Tax=Thiomonas bhubaneswarensis TaxID=339866 RepID=A0A0K6I726_9BURK|nr:ABC-type Fe3+-siderophore transport system, permease component [Thiomonas bhubaneswarensis]